jgi:hypothetical protein
MTPYDWLARLPNLPAWTGWPTAARLAKGVPAW